MSDRKDILFPVGRLVGGSVNKGRDKDFEGRPMVYKSGAKQGQPRLDFSIGVAIPKGPEQSWAQTPWGAEIYAFAQASFPGGQATKPDFSWKIRNGDDATVDDQGKRLCDREGYAGHWVVWFSGSTPPRCCDAKGTTQIDPEMVKAGYYVQVWGNVGSNASVGNPGVYLNHNAVALSGYGAEISLGMDISQVGFGATPLPAGASAVPVGMSAAPALPGAAPAPVPVAPNPALTASATAPLPPLPPTGPRMTAAAGGVAYEAFIAQGWTDALLIQHGMMLA